jgi:FkbM family methyltransferase
MTRTVSFYRKDRRSWRKRPERALAFVVRFVLGTRFSSRFWGWLFDLFRSTYRTEGLEFIIPDAAQRPFRARFFWDVYEQPERVLIRDHLRPHHTVLELGGGIGVVSCLINTRLAERARHVVVEGNPSLLATLRQNRDRNACAFRIEHGIVSNGKDGTFYVHELIVGGSAHRPTNERITVPTLSVPDLEVRHGLQFSAVVMDIEGGELDFLRENVDFVRRLSLVIVELHGFIIGRDKIETCRELMRSAGLKRVGVLAGNEAWVRAA